MYLLLSGEGPSDIGVCYPAAEACSVETFKPGPMAWLVDQWVERVQGFDHSHLQAGLVSFVSKQHLVATRPSAAKKPSHLPGKKRAKETSYYFNNARALAQCAKELAAEIGDDVIAVLFRDSDGTASAGRGDWQTKYDSVLQGFEAEGFPHGVAMIPRPKSEAWLLCALKPESPYQHCAALEQASGNDDSPNSLKMKLDAALQGQTSADELAETAKDGNIQWENIDMPSLDVFKHRVEAVLNLIIRQGG